MSVTKRTRYEVLKRDNHTCRYCHAVDTPLTIDHVIPVALGGTDDPGNLVAACKDCNAGKSSTSPLAETVEDVKQADIRWAVAIAKAADLRATERELVAAYVRDFEDFWKPMWAPDDVYATIENFYRAGLPLTELKDAAYVAICARNVDSRFRYFCGVAWRKVGELQEMAKALLEAEDADST